jgi:hypothetical protein
MFYVNIITNNSAFNYLTFDPNDNATSVPQDYEKPELNEKLQKV